MKVYVVKHYYYNGCDSWYYLVGIFDTIEKAEYRALERNLTIENNSFEDENYFVEEWEVE